jgi:ribosome-associated toxin RatA of RatAB toxin-antitoxin module
MRARIVMSLRWRLLFPGGRATRVVPHVVKSALVPFTAQDMFRLVDRVEDYPGFLPWCSSTAVHERSDGHVVASIEIAKGPLHKRFTTRNALEPGVAIDIRLVDGPFRRLDGHWRFEPLGDVGCKVQLDLDFELSSGLLRKLLEPIFSEIANTMVDAFCSRAREVYGGG